MLGSLQSDLDCKQLGVLSNGGQIIKTNDFPGQLVDLFKDVWGVGFGDKDEEGLPETDLEGVHLVPDIAGFVEEFLGFLKEDQDEGRVFGFKLEEVKDVVLEHTPKVSIIKRK